MWFADSVAPPRSRAWHRLRKHEGGTRVFPLGATGGWWTRRQEAKRMRAALQQHGHGSYDGAMF